MVIPLLILIQQLRSSLLLQHLLQSLVLFSVLPFLFENVKAHIEDKEDETVDETSQEHDVRGLSVASYVIESSSYDRRKDLAHGVEGAVEA